MTTMEMREEINELSGHITKNSLVYAVSILRALKLGEESGKEYARKSIIKGTQELRRSS